jgi:hypothetical protein
MSRSRGCGVSSIAKLRASTVPMANRMVW